MTKSYSRWKEFIEAKQSEIGSEEMYEKIQQRAQIASDVEAFLASDGVIHECSPGDTCDPDTRAFKKGVMRNV